jgi:uncharacterized protein (TIGR02265 family)
MGSVEQDRSLIAGAVLLSRLAFAQERLGPARLEQVLAQLSEPDRESLGRVKEVALYPLDLNIRLDSAIAKELSPGDPDAIYVEMGRASAEKNLTGPHASFLQPGDPQRFLATSKYIYKFYYAVGYRTYERTGNRSGILRTFDAPAASPTDCLTVIGWHERALELCGATQVAVAHPSCRGGGANHCEYHFSWVTP